VEAALRNQAAMPVPDSARLSHREGVHGRPATPCSHPQIVDFVHSAKKRTARLHQETPSRMVMTLAAAANRIVERMERFERTDDLLTMRSRSLHTRVAQESSAPPCAVRLRVRPT
jgi:hypothetical protein